MPSYDYACPQCDHVEEVFHSITADVRILCPKCNIKLERKPSVGSVSFKGKGFYSTGG